MQTSIMKIAIMKRHIFICDACHIWLPAKGIILNQQRTMKGLLPLWLMMYLRDDIIQVAQS